MELSSTVFAETFGPLACVRRLDEIEPATRERRAMIPWDQSLLNPKNRIDSLTPRSHATWRLDGVDVDGRRFFAVPKFAIGGRPTRIDVYIPPVEEHPRDLAEVLTSDTAIYVRGGGAVNLPISQHVLHALQDWSSRIDGFQHLYYSMPYGSRILVSNIAANLEDMDIQLVQSYDAEQAMVGLSELQQMWKFPPTSWPKVVDISELKLQRQLNEAITIVQMTEGHGDTDLAFKSLLRDQRYMYNELKVLLTLPPHPNVIPRPLYIVTVKSRFGSRHGVCGFVMQYFPVGSLKQRLADAATGVRSVVALEDGLRWSIQITKALMSVNDLPFGFYPDLKPDNVVLRQSFRAETTVLDVVLLDFEQRGGWFSWSPPEIAYLEYLEILASQSESPQADEASRMLRRHIPSWHPSSQSDRYQNIDGGFSAPWLGLLNRRQQRGHLKDMLEKAQVFMLGKLLWCIFESEPLVRCGLDRELLQENHSASFEPLAFPEFRRTPADLRRLIRGCTLGAPEWEGRRRPVILRGGKLVPARWSAGSEPPTVEDIRQIVVSWWAEELDRSREFLADVINSDVQDESGSLLLREAMNRPNLQDVLQELQQVELHLN